MHTQKLEKVGQYQIFPITMTSRRLPLLKTQAESVRPALCAEQDRSTWPPGTEECEQVLEGGCFHAKYQSWSYNESD